jgi:S-adenosylmethionine synthetase
LLSQIGRRIDQPHVADVDAVTEEGVAIGDIAPEVQTIVDEQLADVTGVTRRAIDGELTTF